MAAEKDTHGTNRRLARESLMAQHDGGEAVERHAPLAGRVAAGAGIALGVTLVTGGTAHATDYTVTNLDPAGPGSLRDAITTANSDATPDRVLFQSDLSGTIDLNGTSYTGALSITEPLDIVGPGADQVTINADGQSRVFHIQPNTSGDDVSISGLKIIQGNVKYCQYDCQTGPPPFGTPRYSGGNIYSDGADLTLSNMVIRSGGAINAGGVWENRGTLTMRDSTVANNVAVFSGGGIGIARNPTEYAPVEVFGNADQQPTQPSVISGSTINNNSAGTKYDFFQSPQYSGGTRAAAGTDTQAADRPNAGGGVAATSALTIENSTFNHNDDSGRGGGIAFAPYVRYSPEPGAGQLRIESATISGNTAGSGGGVYWYTRRSADDSTSPEPPNPVIENSIVANNQADSPQRSPDIGGAHSQDVIAPPPPRKDDTTRSDVTFDAAFSLFGDTTGATVNETVPGSNITGQDPQLGALNDNGGPTQTMALLPGSPAIDHGRTPAGETSDQRGQTRPFDLPQIGNSAAPGADGADMGAFEVQGAVPTGTCEGKPATISGTENRDVLTGTAGDDVIVGFGGNDIIKALQGNDLVCAGDGQDQVTGGLGNDELHGEGGKDRMTGQAGNDTVLDDAGDDQLNGGVGNDIVKGGAGQDRILGSKGNDRLFGQAAPDVLLGAKGNDFLRGGPGNDRLSGGVGVNDVQQ
jgi:Ca2+-binding RTX toxin-like protein